METSTFKTGLHFMMIILFLCSTPSDAPGGQSCAQNVVYTIPHAEHEPLDIKTHGGRMDRCTETEAYPCWQFYPEREEIHIIGKRYEDFVGLTIDGNAVDGLCTLDQICQHHHDTNKGDSNSTKANSTECSYTGLIIAIVFLAIVVFLLAIALVIALVLLVIAVTRPHVIPNWWNRCTRRRTQSSDTESQTQSHRKDGKVKSECGSTDLHHEANFVKPQSPENRDGGSQVLGIRRTRSFVAPTSASRISAGDIALETVEERKELKVKSLSCFALSTLDPVLKDKDEEPTSTSEEAST